MATRLHTRRESHVCRPHFMKKSKNIQKKIQKEIKNTFMKKSRKLEKTPPHKEESADHISKRTSPYFVDKIKLLELF